jgi:hypothetical protein
MSNDTDEFNDWCQHDSAYEMWRCPKCGAGKERPVGPTKEGKQ